MTLQLFFCEVKLLVDIIEQIIQTGCDKQTGLNFILLSFQQGTQFPTKKGSRRTYPYISKVMPTVPLL